MKCLLIILFSLFINGCDMYPHVYTNMKLVQVSYTESLAHTNIGDIKLSFYNKEYKSIEVCYLYNITPVKQHAIRWSKYINELFIFQKKYLDSCVGLHRQDGGK